LFTGQGQGAQTLAFHGAPPFPHSLQPAFQRLPAIPRNKRPEQAEAFRKLIDALQ
jgi:hypothetical protein